MSFDPHADPLSDPVLAELAAGSYMKAADHPWELERPPDFDPIEAIERFLRLVQRVNAIVGAECEIELWPGIRDATFHGEIVLPASALSSPNEGFAMIRVSNFGGLVAILNDDSLVKPEILAALLAAFDRTRYKRIPSAVLARPYAGHHRGTRQFPLWRDRLFGYL